MKDLSTLDNYKEFILSYKIVDNKIIVKLASQEDYIIPFIKIVKYLFHQEGFGKVMIQH